MIAHPPCGDIVIVTLQAARTRSVPACTFRIAEGAAKQYIAVQTRSTLDEHAMTLTTLNDIFFAATERNLDRVMLSRASGKWLPISSSDLRRNIAATAHALREWSVRKGDRVAILSENRPEWSTADFAILLLGAVTVPVYATLTPEQTAYTLRDSGASVVFVSTEHQLRKIQTILPQTQIQRIVVMDQVQLPSDLAATCMLMSEFMTQGSLHP